MGRKAHVASLSKGNLTKAVKELNKLLAFIDRVHSKAIKLHTILSGEKPKKSKVVK